jgi:ABC-type transport system involved in multi-copper enzyme maturation permease subunit
MVVRLRQIASIAKVTMLEGARKQVFHVLMLFGVSLITISTLLGVFDHNMMLKFVKDLASVSILVSSGIIAITLSVSGIPADIENKTAYPVLAKPIARWQFVAGKYLGVVVTVAIGMVIMMAAFAGILYAFSGQVDAALFIVMPYLLLEAAIMAAVAIALSTVCTPALSWFLALIIYITGNMKFWICNFMAKGDHAGIGKAVAAVIYQLLPNLECFNFKDALIHGLPVPAGYLLQTALYGLCYTGFALCLATLAFKRREL